MCIWPPTLARQRDDNNMNDNFILNMFPFAKIPKRNIVQCVNHLISFQIFASQSTTRERTLSFEHQQRVKCQTINKNVREKRNKTDKINFKTTRTNHFLGQHFKWMSFLCCVLSMALSMCLRVNVFYFIVFFFLIFWRWMDAIYLLNLFSNHLHKTYMNIKQFSLYISLCLSIFLLLFSHFH